MTADDRLLFVALGGVGEIGINCYLYGLAGQWLMVDLGIGFADERLPGAELLLPDLRWIEGQRERLAGLVLTHVHEDHFGAVPYLWERLRCPVWCTRFAATVLARKCEDLRVEPPRPLHIVEPGERFRIGPFDCRLFHVAHSIPEANALGIETPFGRLLHTGDWKLDPLPLIGERTDAAGIEAFGHDSILALVADSTNAMVPGTAGSEGELRDSLEQLIARQPFRVAFTTFSSNIARIESAVRAAKACGREIVVVGRSMHRMLEAAVESGYLRDLPRLRDESDGRQLARERSFYLVTGSQGEPRSALQRIASGQHPRVRLEAGDTVIFSAKIIPGNERTLFDLHNRLVAAGIEVVTEEDHFVHVSGHPCREDMEQMYRWTRPRIAVPVHGEMRHLHAHLRFARELRVPYPMLVTNGDLLQLAPGEPRVIDRVPTGRLVVETDVTLAEDDELFRTRRRIAQNGTLFVSLVMDPWGSLLERPRIVNVGAIDAARFARERERLIDAVEAAVETLEDEAVMEDGRVQEAARIGLRQALGLPRHKRPLVEVEIVRLSEKALAELESAEGSPTTR
ncbi:Ribonuclease J [bacterium HR40]|nr:Ribonuclease J [bacterium HR40]